MSPLRKAKSATGSLTRGQRRAALAWASYFGLGECVTVEIEPGLYQHRFKPQACTSNGATRDAALEEPVDLSAIRDEGSRMRVVRQRNLSKLGS